MFGNKTNIPLATLFMAAAATVMPTPAQAKKVSGSTFQSQVNDADLGTQELQTAFNNILDIVKTYDPVELERLIHGRQQNSA